MKIGLVAFAADERDAAQQAAQQAVERIAAALRDGLSPTAEPVVVTAEQVVHSPLARAREAGRLARADTDGVVFFVADVASANAVARAALPLAVPILLWAEDPAALLASAEMLLEIGVPFERALGSADAETARAQALRWAGEQNRAARERGAEAAHKLYGARYGYFAPLPPFLDAAQWLSHFGVEVVFLDAAAAQERAARITSDRIAAAREAGERLLATFAQTNADVLDRALRAALSLRDLCREHELAFCSLPDAADAHDLVVALMNAGAFGDEEPAPIPCGPPGDANGALTLQLLRLATDAPIGSGRLHSLRPEGLVLEGMPLLTEGASEVTLARLIRRAGRYACLIATGEAVSRLDNSAEAASPDEPRIVIRLDDSGDRFVQTWASPYVAFAEGSHVAALQAACRALDIEAIRLD